MPVFKEELSYIGKFTKVHGVRGNLILLLEAKLSEELTDSSWLFVEELGEAVPWKVEAMQFMDEKQVMVKFEGLSTPEQAAKCTNLACYIPTAHFNSDTSSNLLPQTFISYSLFDDEERIGEVVDFIRNTNQELLVVAGSEKEYLIPFVEEFVLKIDKQRKAIFTNLPKGLLDL